MRAGDLDTPAHILVLGADLVVQQLDWIWCGIQTKESAEPPFPSGLRQPAKVAIRAWWDCRLQQGRYLRTDTRLFILDSVRDFTGTKLEVAITATEFVGECGEYRPDGRAPIPCRVFLNHDARYLDENGQAVEYRVRAEVALVETGRVQVDEQLQVAGVLYNVIDYADDSDDGIVRGLWLERV